MKTVFRELAWFAAVLAALWLACRAWAVDVAITSVVVRATPYYLVTTNADGVRIYRLIQQPTNLMDAIKAGEDSGMFGRMYEDGQAK